MNKKKEGEETGQAPRFEESGAHKAHQQPLSRRYRPFWGVSKHRKRRNHQRAAEYLQLESRKWSP
jgi:hypothetical protein